MGQSHFQIEKCDFTGNTATSTGGGFSIANSASGSITGSTFRGNNAALGGGISVASGSLTITNSTIFNNTADFQGGGVNQGGGTLQMIACTVTGNHSPHAPACMRGDRSHSPTRSSPGTLATSAASPTTFAASDRSPGRTT